MDKKNSSIEKIAIKIQGVTYYSRQNNLKELFEQHLDKKDKHLSLEKFYIGNKQTFCVMFNGLEIGTIPDEYLNKFLSEEYNYELTNLHIGIIKDKYGNDIYYARLFVSFYKADSESEDRIESEKIVYLNNQLDEANESIKQLNKKLSESNKKVLLLEKSLKDEQNKPNNEEITLKQNNTKLKRIIVINVLVSIAILITAITIIKITHDNKNQEINEINKYYSGIYHSFELVDYSRIVHPGESAFISIKGSPKTEYSINVTYSSGSSDASGLVNKTSNDKGELFWSWKVGTRTYSGKHSITITDGNHALIVYFYVE